MPNSINDMIHQSKQRTETSIGTFCHKCLSLSTDKEEFLRPYKVHKIMIPLLNFKTDSRLFQVFNHLVEKPWRVITTYIFINKQFPYISIYLISPIYRRMAPQEEICHLMFINPEEMLYDLKGTPLLLYSFIVVSNNYLIFKIICI